MLLYEMLIAIGIAVALVVAATGGSAARVMRGPGEMALLRAARAAAAQRRLVAAAAQREARAAAAQRRLVAAAAQREARAAAAQRLVAATEQDARRTRSPRKPRPPRIELSNAYWTRCFKLQYEDVLAAPLPPRLATLITQLEAQA